MIEAEKIIDMVADYRDMFLDAGFMEYMIPPYPITEHAMQSLKAHFEKVGHEKKDSTVAMLYGVRLQLNIYGSA